MCLFSTRAAVTVSQLVLSSEQVAELYEGYESEVDFFAALTKELTRGRAIVMVIEKKNGVAEWLNLLGPEDAELAVIEAPLSIRGTFGSSRIKNAAHGSPSPSSALKEIKLFFPRVFPRESTLCIVMPGTTSSTEAIVSMAAADGFLVVATSTVQLDTAQASRATPVSHRRAKQ